MKYRKTQIISHQSSNANPLNAHLKKYTYISAEVTARVIPNTAKRLRTGPKEFCGQSQGAQSEWT